MGSAKRDADTAQVPQPSNRTHRFPKSVRLRKRREFLSVQTSGKRIQGRYFLAVVTPRSRAEAPPDGRAPGGRVGITVTKKIGNAVTRNRIKRMVREYLRQSTWLQRDVESVIIARRGAETLTHYRQVAADLARIQADLEGGRHGRRRRGTRRGRRPC